MSLTPDQLAHQFANVHDNVQPNIYAACGICLLSAYLAVTLRFVSRRLKHAPLGGDDYTIIVALVRRIHATRRNIYILKVYLGLHHRLCRNVYLQYVHRDHGTGTTLSKEINHTHQSQHKGWEDMQSS